MFDKYCMQISSSDEATTSLNDIEQVLQLQKNDAGDTDNITANKQKVVGQHDSPLQVMLCPGTHKYMLVKATHPSNNEDRWFVKSAAPSQCGGLYHANIAEDLV